MWTARKRFRASLVARLPPCLPFGGLAGTGQLKMDTDQIKRALDRTRADFAKVPTSEHAQLIKAIIAENDVVLGVFNDDEHFRG